MIVPMTLFYTATASTSVATANQLSVTHGVDNVNVAQVYSQVGTKTLFGELYSQGNSNAWPASGFPFAADGHGFLLERSIVDLSNNELVAGSYSATIRLATGHTDGTLIGTLSGCSILVRIFRYDGTNFTTILIMSISNQIINQSITTFSLSGSTVVATPFEPGDMLYSDALVAIGGNSNADSLLQIRLNRLSTNMTGDTNAQIVTPGYQAIPAPNGIQIRRQMHHHIVGRIQ